MLTLESFKLLGAKPGRLTPGTGGVPDITFQEVADVLASVPYEVSVYARLIYGQEWHLNGTLRQVLLDQLHTDDDETAASNVDYWPRIIQIAVGTASSAYHLTASQKAVAMGVKWWHTGHEQDYQAAASILDVYDAEIRIALGKWNEKQREDNASNV
tara:strand:- start:29 stop:499 length:471 start_codon:yes stop_codon:yes gene_type:complete